MKNSQINHNETRSGKRTVFLRAGAITSIIIIMTSFFLINQTPSGSHNRTGMILTTVAGSLTFVTFFLQLRQNKPSD
jgi:hypothetical protein